MERLKSFVPSRKAAKEAEPPPPEPPPPNAYNVSGAGNPKANGVYHLDASQSDSSGSSVYLGPSGLWLYLLKGTWTSAFTRFELAPLASTVL